MAFGTAIIIVNRICKGEKVRKGATQDYTKMETMFKELGFEVIPRYNITRSEIENEFQQASSIQSDILVFVISTHGEESHLANINSDGTKVYDQMILGSDGQTISVNHLLKQLDNDALRGKTKLCFIQACRSIKGMKGAQNLDLGVTVKVAGGKEIHQAIFDDKADDMGLTVKMRPTKEKETPELCRNPKNRTKEKEKGTPELCRKSPKQI